MNCVILAAAMLSAISCSKSDAAPDDAGYLVVPETVIKNGILVEEGATETTPITVRCSATPVAKTAATWFEPELTKAGTSDAWNLVLKISDNSTAQPNGTLSIEGGGKSVNINVVKNGNSKPAVENKGIVGPTPRDVALQMGFGWNLGDQFDGFVRLPNGGGMGSETGFGNPVVNPRFISSLAERGIKTVRIPITWLGQFGNAPTYKINDAHLNRIDEVLEYCNSAGLNVIINTHHDNAELPNGWQDILQATHDPAYQKTTLAKIKALWGQIAERFKDKGPWLAFEGFNEIQDGHWSWFETEEEDLLQTATLAEWNQTFVDAVRATGGNNATRYLCVPSIAANPEHAIKRFKIPNDPAGKIMVAVHCYDPYDFALTAEIKEWGHTGTNTHEGYDEKQIVSVFSRLKAKFIDNGVPVYLGEMGCVNRDDERGRAFRKYYLEYVVKAAHDNGIPCCIWDNGKLQSGNEAHAIFNRETTEFYGDNEQVFPLLIKAATSEDPRYTLYGIYSTAPVKM